MRHKAGTWSAAAWALAVLVHAGCAGQEDLVSNTGYTGTWTKGNDRAKSIIAIVRDGDAYRFKWSVYSRDGKWKVRCNWDGACEEFVDGEKTSEYRFRTWVDDETGHLMVDCTGKVFKPRELDVHYVDELVLSDDGRTLWSYTLERAGQRFEGDARPRRKFTKISDGVAHPPRTARVGPEAEKRGG